jgi:hypothetical protein
MPKKCHRAWFKMADLPPGRLKKKDTAGKSNFFQQGNGCLPVFFCLESIIKYFRKLSKKLSRKGAAL